MRLASWLQSSGIPKYLQIKDLPFDREKLFSAKTVEVLHSMKDSRTTLRTMGIDIPPIDLGDTNLITERGTHWFTDNRDLSRIHAKDIVPRDADHLSPSQLRYTHHRPRCNFEDLVKGLINLP